MGIYVYIDGSLDHSGIKCSYAEFHRLRHRIAQSCGLDDWDMYENGTFADLKDHPIFPFINNKDYDGRLTPEECKQVIPVLESIFSQWYEQADGKQFGEKLIALMRRCADEGKDLRFG